jgi:hypothetical protein
LAEAEPGVLDSVVGFGERAQHSVGDRLKMGPMLLEAIRQPLVLVQGHILAPSVPDGFEFT